MTSEEMSDDELVEQIGESACASRPAREKETLAEYLERIAREDTRPTVNGHQLPD